MQKEAKPAESALSLEIQDVMKNLISAIRTVKIYPPNNPIYTQSLKKAFETLSQALETDEEYHVGIQKTYFLYLQTPVGKDAQVNRSIAQDLFGKGVREIIFSAGLEEPEFLELLRTLALSLEELAMKSGISTVLWEKGVTHIKVTEAGLDEVITTKTDGGWETTPDPTAQEEQQAKQKKADFTAKTLVLGDLKTDPEGFGVGMIEFAMRTKAAYESVEDRLFTLYQQAGKKIQKDHAHESEALFEGLAKSALALESPHRDSLIGGKLYGDLDAEIAADTSDDQFAPTPMHEVWTGRYSNAWTIQQVAVLLKRAAAKKIVPASPPAKPGELPAAPLGRDLLELVQGLMNETPEEVEALRLVSSAGMESDIIEAAIRTLIPLLTLVKNPFREGPAEKEKSLFSGVIKQLEDILSYLLKNNQYDLATTIIKALRSPVAPEFQPRMAEALKKTATKPIIKSTITDMKRHVKSSAEYQAAYSYLASLDQKAIEALLELLAEENDREMRIFLLDLMKEFGRNQIPLLGEHLSDERWYVVRNIVSILGESKLEQAVVMLRKAADNRNAQVRQEVIKALLSIGGKRAGALLAKFLKDPDPSIQLMAVRTFSDIPGIGEEEAKPLIEFLVGRPLNPKEHEMTLAAIKSLGKTGGRDAAVFLETYNRIRWWKSRRLQTELRDAAARSLEEIMRRHSSGR